MRELIKSRHARNPVASLKKKEKENRTNHGGNDKVVARVFSCFPERIGGRGRNVFRDFDSRSPANRLVSRNVDRIRSFA